MKLILLKPGASLPPFEASFGLAAFFALTVNEASTRNLEINVGLEKVPAYHDIDGLTGTWIPDPASDQAITEMPQVNKDPLK